MHGEVGIGADRRSSCGTVQLGGAGRRSRPSLSPIPTTTPAPQLSVQHSCRAGHVRLMHQIDSWHGLALQEQARSPACHPDWGEPGKSWATPLTPPTPQATALDRGAGTYLEVLAVIAPSLPGKHSFFPTNQFLIRVVAVSRGPAHGVHQGLPETAQPAHSGGRLSAVIRW